MGLKVEPGSNKSCKYQPLKSSGSYCQNLFGRLVNLQVFNASDLQKKARLIQTSKTSSLKKRRSIVDRNNRLIAYDKPLYKLWAHPKYFNFPGDSNKRVCLLYTSPSPRD